MWIDGKTISGHFYRDLFGVCLISHTCVSQGHILQKTDALKKKKWFLDQTNLEKNVCSIFFA